MRLVSSQIFGIIACLERFLADSDERGARFFYGLLDKQHTRLKGSFDRHVVRRLMCVGGRCNSDLHA